MTNDKIKQAAEYGFIKRATAYGYTEMAAKQILKKHAFDAGPWIDERLKSFQAPQLDPSKYKGVDDAMSKWMGTGGQLGAALGGLGAGAGGLLGAGVGALGGHLMGGTDEEKSKHRWQGAALGGGLGALGGGALGGYAGGFAGMGAGMGLSADHPEFSQYINQTKGK